MLSENPQLDLAATVLFVKERETGMRSAGVLSYGTPAIGQANNAVVVVDYCVHSSARGENKYCGRTGQGTSPSGEVREKSCPSWKK